MTAIEPQRKKVKVQPKKPKSNPKAKVYLKSEIEKSKPKPKVKVKPPPKTKLTQRIPGVLEIDRPKGFSNANKQPKSAKNNPKFKNVNSTESKEILRTDYNKTAKEPDPYPLILNRLIELSRSITVLLKEHSKSQTDDEAFLIELKIEEMENIMNEIISEQINRGRVGINIPRNSTLFTRPFI